MLRPSGRSAAGYRRYSADDDRRLAAICLYRRAGLSLAAIRDLLDAAGSTLARSAPPTPGHDAPGTPGHDAPGTPGHDTSATPGHDAPADAETELSRALFERLQAIDGELRELRGQQRFILAYLRADPAQRSLALLTAAQFVELFEAAGVGEEQRARWHAAFERADGDGHQAFLEYLCLPDDMIVRIRQASAVRHRRHDGES